jgi:tetratricopeptide (TPR) repeat protein
LTNQSAAFRKSNSSSFCPLGDIPGEGAAYCNIGCERSGIAQPIRRGNRAPQEGSRDIAADWWVLANQSAAFRKSNFSSFCPLADISGEGAAYANMGVALEKLSRHDEAIEMYKKKLEISQQIGEN